VGAWYVADRRPASDECTAAERGPAPAAPNFLRDDGSVGGPGTWVRNDGGVCAWTFRDCPP